MPGPVTPPHHESAPLRVIAADPAARRRFNRLLFDMLAPRYDRQNRWISFGRDPHWKHRLIASLPTAPNLDAVDLACGTGDLTRRLASRYPSGTVTGVDLSPAMLDLARRSDRSGRIRWICADMSRTGLPDRCADVVTGAWALRLAESVEAGLRESARLLRPGGTAAFLDFARPDSALGNALLFTLLGVWSLLASILICGHTRAHTWIPVTLRDVPPRRELHRCFQRCGFAEIRRVSAFFGAVDLWTARRCPQG
ncbi:MAG: class I SAM-dependent methyltransferase [Kiritimatiellae bacterium]|nr:class I SAM-dependent methyltransferase [Kiritimatiellia bacterium]